MINEKRRYTRIDFDRPLCSKLFIEKIDGKEIDSGYSHVCVKNISPGGLCFISMLNIPENKDIVLKFEISMKNHIIILSGKIMRKIEKTKGIYEYGVKFLMDEDMHSVFTLYMIDLAKRARENELDDYICSMDIDKCVLNNL